MRVLVWVQAFGTVLGLLCIFLATKYRTAEHPGWYRGVIFSLFGWKRSWWTRTGYYFQRVGTILLFIGVAAVAVYWGRYCFMDC